MTKNVAVVLCGAGARDGSEIHESVLTLLHLAKNGASVHCYAPAGPQARVINHLTNEVMEGERSMIVEAARIARGKVRDLADLSVNDADALIFPGGNGSAYNLCTFADKGAQCSVNPQVSRVIDEFYAAKKPIGFICIAPAIGARVLGPKGVSLTVGSDASAAASLQEMGARHVPCSVKDIHVDEKNRIVSTPAYMLAKNIAEVDEGVGKLVQAVLRLATVPV